MTTSHRLTGVIAVAALLIGLASCARAVAGDGGAGDPTCIQALAAERPAPSPMKDEAPVITVDVGSNFWVPTWHTAPLTVVAYANGVVIRAQDAGAHAEPLPDMVIGRIDPCVLADAVRSLTALASTDLGDPAITDQGTTFVTVRPSQDDTPIEVSAYALGIGDEYVEPAQRAARERLGATIDGLQDAMTDERTWAPDRLRLTWFDNADAGSADTFRDWPLADPIDALLRPGSGPRYPCAVVEGADAAAVIAALGRWPALSQWGDGSRTATIAVGILVPGQPGCPSA